MTYSYQVYVVDGATYEAHRVGDRYQGGRVVDGIGGMGQDQLLVVAYTAEDRPWLSSGTLGAV